MICPKCGTPLPDDAVFCGLCGMKVAAQEVKTSSGRAIKGSLVTGEMPGNRPESPTINAYNSQPNVPAYTAPEIIPAYVEKPVIPEKVPFFKRIPKWVMMVAGGVLAAVVVLIVLIATGVFKTQKYCVVEKAVRYNADGDKVYTVNVDVNKQGLPESMEMVYSDGRVHSYEFTYEGKRLSEVHYECPVSDTGYYGFDKEYNDYGDVIRHTEYYKGEIVVTQYNYRYDKDGNMLSKSCEDKYGNVNRYVWEYDKDGNVLLYTSYNNNEKRWEYVHEVDKFGHTIFTEYTDYENASNSYTSSSELEYEGKNLVEETYYEDGEKVRTTTYKYDKKGRLTEEKTRYDEGATYEYEYEYDSKGNVVEHKRKRNNELWVSYEYEYDKKGNLVEEKAYEYGELRYRTKYSYYGKKLKLSDAQKELFYQYDLTEFFEVEKP